MTVAQMEQFSRERPAKGEARATPGAGTAAVARIPAAGAGDIVLIVSQDTDITGRDQALTGAPLQRAGAALAAQLHG
ncbi:hypothetical protein J5Y04_30550 [Kitasatospora sp. RG8]|uniref:hypothetical protein n=1 Tax=Kitasatospora sp. RG8 TaxID=2820815 RepID=UPI001AE06C90|nr:hypothetical protein [Kitasatospora sp. RG8]MBP0453850.1 hypothetical protein [Kitasatospora sp. RG8]